MTQADIALAAGLTRAPVIAVESGRGSYASLEHLLRFLGQEIRGRPLPPGDNLGRRLAELRRRRALSRAAVAAVAGITDSTLTTIEAGTVGNLMPLERVALVLGAGLQLAPINSRTSVWSGVALASVYQSWTTPAALLKKLYPLVGGKFHLDPCSPRLDGPFAQGFGSRKKTMGSPCRGRWGVSFAIPRMARTSEHGSRNAGQKAQPDQQLSHSFQPAVGRAGGKMTWLSARIW